MVVKTVAGQKAYIAAGVIRVKSETYKIRNARIRLTERQIGVLDRAKTATTGAVIGLLAGPIGALAGASLGAAFAPGRQSHDVQIDTEDGPSFLLMVPQKEIAALELATGFKLG